MVSRRRFAATASLSSLALVPAACGTNDAAVFDDAATVSTDGVHGSLADSTATSETSLAGNASPADGSSIPASAELVVDFTFAIEQAGGRIHDPYVAVWVEDSEGNLVDTISLWYQQGRKGQKWLNDLVRWYDVSDQAADTSMSGATQVAGSYSVVWDGTGLDGQKVAAGDYVLYIEAAREKGPYQLISAPISLGSDDASVTFEPSGELTDASATFSV